MSVNVPAVSTKKPDFSSLKKEEVKEEFENTIKKALQEKEIKTKEDRLTRLKGAMTIAIDTLPRVPKRKEQALEPKEERMITFLCYLN